jgi:co-chaperonin GroES (HSP10)
MNIKPLKKTVAVVRLKNKETSESGLIIKGNIGASIDKAKAIAIGPDVTLLKVGDTLLVDWNKVNPTTIDGIPTYFLSEDDVAGVFDK